VTNDGPIIPWCTGRLGLGAFFGAGSELWLFFVSLVGSPQPPVTLAVGPL
jgi:hypothetical protein